MGYVQARCYACGHGLWVSDPRLQCAKCGTEPPPNPGERFLQYEDGELVKIVMHFGTVFAITPGVIAHWNA